MNTQFYKGVKLIEGRTAEMIDIVIENHKTKNAVELGKLLGFDSFRLVTSILRVLYANGIINKEDKPKKVVGLKRGRKPKIQPEVKVKKEKILKCVAGRKNPFTNYDGDGKLKARELISNSIASTGTTNSNILTLPADKWMMEKLILSKQPKHKFTAVEKEVETYKDMIRNMSADNELLESVVSTHNSDIKEVIRTAIRNSFSSAILDYCGVVDTVYDEVKLVLENQLVRIGGYITVTVTQVNRTMNHKLHMNNYTNRFAKICYKGITSEEITNHLILDLIFATSGYEIKERLIYQDKTPGYGMMLYIIPRVS